MSGKIKQVLGGILSALMLISAAAPAFAAEPSELGVPRDLAVPAAATTYSSISVLWDKPEDYKDITGYNVYINGTKTAETAADTTYYTAENLTANTEYTITVKAVKGSFESAASNAVTAKTDIKGTMRDVTAAPYNAVGDGVTNDTAAIQAAIDACADNDIVLLPEGKTFLSGALDLKSNMTFEVNGTLAGIQTASEYEKKGDTNTYEGGTTTTGSVYTAEAPKRLIWSRSEGWEQYCYRSLINVGYLTQGTNYGTKKDYTVSGVKIIGKGTITGSPNTTRTQYTPISGQASALAIAEGDSAETFYDLTASNANDVTTNNIRSRIRGRLINISNAQNVYIKGVELSRPPMWTVHMIYSDSVTTNGVKIETSGYRNGDGWDPDSSSNCTIYGSNFHTGDDCVAIKSGKNPEGNTIARPSKNIKVIGCTSNGGLGLAVGSEMSGGVEDVYVRDCAIAKSSYGVELKANKVRGGYIRNFNVQDSAVDQVLIHSVTYNGDGAAAATPPVFSNINFKNITIKSVENYGLTETGTGITLDGFSNDADSSDDSYYIDNVSFEDVVVGGENNTDQTVLINRSKNVTFRNIKQIDGNQPIFSLSDSSNIKVDGEDAETIVPAFTKTIEAERMKPEGFVAESNSYASNGKVLKLSGRTGNVQAKYNGTDGKKNITVAYFDENDGDETYELYVNAEKKDEWTANTDFGSGDADSATLTSHTTKDVELSQGDMIKLVVTVTTQYGSGRIDKITVAGDGENNAPSAPTGLLTNELTNPLNVEEPTFGWLVNDEDENEVQTAYELVITDEVTGDVVWDSGKVRSSDQSYVGMVEGEPINDNPDDGDVIPITFGYTMQSGKLTGVDVYRNENTNAATVYIASYDSLGNLARLLTKPLEAGDADTEVNYELQGNDAVELEQNGIIKLFAWEDSSEGTTMKPLSETEEIDGVSSGAAHSSEGSENIESLEAAHPYSWKVRTWDKNDEVSPYSVSAFFTTGLSGSEWDEAEWISDGTGGMDKTEGTYNHFWYARTKQARTSEQTVTKALAYFVGAQDYDLYVNNTEIGRGQTFDYTSEARYQGWDVTEAVNKDTANITAGALVRTYGGGQGRAPVNAGLLGYIKLYYADGTTQVVTTNTTDWKVSKTTAFTENGTTRNGEGDFVEQYDASKAQDNFTASGFDDSSWTAAQERADAVSVTVADVITDTGNTSQPIPELSKPTSYEVEPVEIKVLNDGTTVADFGQVIPARPEITFQNGTANKKLEIQTGYTIGDNGKIRVNYGSDTHKVYTQTTDMRYYYTQIAGEQTYNTWDHLAFRYIQIPSCGETFTKETLKAKVVHTDVPEGRDSTFATSNETLNGVYKLMKDSALYSIQNSFVDTPTREKGQFLNDAINISAASTTTWFEREASKKAIDQFIASADRYWTENGKPMGRFNSVYPNVDGKRDIPDFSLNFPYWIWNYYMQTGDKATLEKAYPYMRAVADYIAKYTNSSTGLVTKLEGGWNWSNRTSSYAASAYTYGIVDWPAVGRNGYGAASVSNKAYEGAITTVNMLSVRALDTIALAADELGETEDVTAMQTQSETLANNINTNLMNTTTKLYKDGSTSDHNSQHASSYALAAGIVPEGNIEAVSKFVANQGMKQGPMTADILVKGLFASGQDTAALRLFTNIYDYGWAKEVANGYTFTFESWEADTPEKNLSAPDSQSHGWGAAAVQDILENFAGVKVTEPGASIVSIAPVYVDLETLNAEVSTERGKVGVSYTYTPAAEETEAAYEITLTIPSNMKADVTLPNVGEGTYRVGSKTGTAVENTFTLGSGTYKYVFDGTITAPESAEVEEPENLDTVSYSFKELSTDTKSQADASGDYAYNDMITLHFASSSSAISADDGFNMYTNDYLKFEAPYTGTVVLTGKARKNSSGTSDLYYSVGAVGTDAAKLRGDTNDSSTTTIATIEVEAGKTYYFYNTNGARPTSITTFTYSYPHVPVIGITGSADTVNKLYTWTIGNEDEENTENKYTYSDNYASITVGIDASDSMSEEKGIVYSKSPVPESGGLTTRYIIVEPKVSGTFTINATGNGSQNNRVYYKNFGTDGVDLSACTKSTGTGQTNIPVSAATDVNIDMTAGNKYVVYLYTNASGGSVSAMSYKYNAEPEAEPVPAENIPYEAPDAEKTVTEAVGDAITLDRDTYPLVVGNTSKTTFDGWETNGSEITVTATLSSGSASNLTWSVDDSDIAYISSTTDTGTGSVRVKGKRTGTTRLVASLSETEKAVCELVVIDNVTRSTVQTLSFNADAITLAKDNTATLIPIITPKDVFGNGALNTDIGWASSDNSVATVSDGVVTAVAPGTATIMAKSDDVGRRAYCTVTVTDTAAAQGENPQPVNIGGIKVGETKQLEGTSVTWRSDDPSIADVDANGLVTAYATTKIEKLEANTSYDATATNNPAKASKDKIIFENGKVKYDEGSVNIYATAADGTIATYTLTVAEADTAVQDIVLSDTTLNIAAGAGNAKTITAAVLPSKLMDAEVEWSSDTPAVATVTKSDRTVEELNAATITGVSAGTAVITASYGGKTVECNVTVTADTVNVSGITVTGRNEIDIDEVVVLDAAITPTNVTDSELLWLSSNADVVSINDDGMIQGLKKGSATIYAIAADRLTSSERTELEALQYERTASASDVTAFLSGKTYGSIEITVKNSSPYLRNLHAPEEAVTATSVNLLWNSNSKIDITDLAGYNVYVNDEKVAEKIDQLGYTADGLTAETAYTFKVEAVNSGGAVLETATVQATTKASPAQVIDVTSAPYNAKGDGIHTDTYAIQKAIDACPEDGEVILPTGKVFLSGALYLKSDMTFRVDGVLLGSVYSKDYPFHVTRWEGWRKVNLAGNAWGNTTSSLPDNHYAHSSLINAGVYDEGRYLGHTGAYNIENLVICGNGQINANGFKLGYNEGVNQKTGGNKQTSGTGLPVPMTPALDQSIRGRAITIHNSDNLYMKDVLVAYSPSWTIHPIYSRNLTFDGMEVVARGSGVTGAADDICILNGDGIDPDSSIFVNIFDTYFRTGDDAVAIKTGRDKEGNELKKPSQFIRVTDSINKDSKGGFVTGSENASGVKNILFQNLTSVSTILGEGVRMKSAWGRGGISENVIMRDIVTDASFYIDMDYANDIPHPADKFPEYRYITLENITRANKTDTPYMYIKGLAAAHDRSATYVNNVTIRGAGSRGEMTYVKDTLVTDSDASKWSVNSSTTDNISFMTTAQLNSTDIAAKDTASNIIEIDNSAHTIKVNQNASSEDIIAELTGADGQTQGYDIDGNTLTVTSYNGENTQDYTITKIDPSTLTDDTHIKKNGDSVVAVGESSIVAVESATEDEIKASIASMYGNTQNYEISGTTLTVTAGGETANYTIKRQTTWDFTNEYMATAGANTTVAYKYGSGENEVDSNVEVKLGGSSDYIDTSVGVHINGKTNSANRYIKIIVPGGGTLSATAQLADSRYSAALYQTTSSNCTGGSAIPNLSMSGNQNWTTGEFEVTNGTTYYLYFSNSGIEVKSLTFTPMAD